MPVYISDCTRLRRFGDWRPQRGRREILDDTFTWIPANERAVRHAIS